jgi:hypothetical protein
MSTVLYKEMIENYSYMKQKANANYKVQIGQISTWEFLKNKFEVIDKIKKFYLVPFYYFSGSHEGTMNVDRFDPSLRPATPLSDLSPKNRYLYCDDPTRALRAAQMLVATWLLASELLSEKKIPVHFILQPAAAYQPSRYQLVSRQG